MESEEEWLRQSFMKVDELLLTDQVQLEIEEMRRQQPPERSALLTKKPAGPLSE